MKKDRLNELGDKFFEAMYAVVDAVLKGQVPKLRKGHEKVCDEARIKFRRLIKAIDSVEEE